MKINKIIVLTVSLATLPQLYAGELLKMKSGDIVLQDRSENLLTESFVASTGGSKYFVVQFNQTIDRDTEEALATLGLRTIRYLPDDAYLVCGDERTVGLVKSSLPQVKAVAHYQPEWKLSEEFHGISGVAHRIEQVAISTLEQEVLPAVLAEVSRIPGVRIKGKSGRDFTVEAPLSSLPALAEIEGIEWIERLPYLITMDFDPGVPAGPASRQDYTYTGYESGTRLMGFEAAWSRGYFGQGQLVGVADTGLDSGDPTTLHPDFVDNFYKGFAVGLGSKSWEDSMGHGTHVAGSVLGSGKASDLHLRGGAHQAKLVMLGLWSALLDNLAPGSDFEKIMGPAYNQGARVHTNSWGAAGNFGAYDSMASRVDEYMWNHPDMLVLFAAGNSGVDANADGRIDENSVGSPGTAKNVLTVGASENELAVGGIQKKLKELRNGDKNWGVEPLASDTISNNGNGLACFSSRGPTKDGRIKPEIVAPGTNIISTRSHHPKASALWGEFDKNYVYAGGTSMATPLTAGAAAVTREYLIKARHLDNPSGALVKATLMHTALDLYPGQYGTGPKQEIPTRRPNIHEGYGRVDMNQVTSLAGETSLLDEKDGVATGEQKVYLFNVKAGGALRATLSYTDAPAAVSAAQALVNDLDLSVIMPSGESKTLGDHTNNSEMIELANLAAGEYRVVVRGTNVPKGKSGKQPFALVVGNY